MVGRGSLVMVPSNRTVDTDTLRQVAGHLCVEAVQTLLRA